MNTPTRPPSPLPPRHLVSAAPSSGEKLRSALAALARDEGGTSLTEFIIALPIMITIMVGTLSIHKLYQTGMEVRGEANRLAWSQALEEQTKLASTNANPLISGIDSVISGAAFGGSFSEAVVDNLADPPGAGIYGDSYLKVQIADVLFTVGAKPQFTVPKILTSTGSTNNSVTAISLSDFPGKPSGGGGFEGILSGILSVSGARPGITGGIRYGAGREKVTRSYSAHGFETELTGEYRISNPTRPTNRMFAMALWRLDLNASPQSCSRTFFKDSVLPFTMTPKLCFGTGPTAPSEEEIDQMTEECTKELETYGQKLGDYERCKARVISIGCGSRPRKPECAGGEGGAPGQDGKKMIDCIKKASDEGKDPQQAGCF